MVEKIVIKQMSMEDILNGVNGPTVLELVVKVLKIVNDNVTTRYLMVKEKIVVYLDQRPKLNHAKSEIVQSTEDGQISENSEHVPQAVVAENNPHHARVPIPHHQIVEKTVKEKQKNHKHVEKSLVQLMELLLNGLFSANVLRVVAVDLKNQLDHVQTLNHSTMERIATVM